MRPKTGRSTRGREQLSRKKARSVARTDVQRKHTTPSLNAGPPRDYTRQKWLIDILKGTNNTNVVSKVVAYSHTGRWWKVNFEWSTADILRTGFGIEFADATIVAICDAIVLAFAGGQIAMRSYGGERNNIPRSTRSTIIGIIMWYRIWKDAAEAATGDCDTFLLYILGGGFDEEQLSLLLVIDIIAQTMNVDMPLEYALKTYMQNVLVYSCEYTEACVQQVQEYSRKVLQPRLLERFRPCQLDICTRLANLPKGTSAASLTFAEGWQMSVYAILLVNRCLTCRYCLMDENCFELLCTMTQASSDHAAADKSVAANPASRIRIVNSFIASHENEPDADDQEAVKRYLEWQFFAMPTPGKDENGDSCEENKTLMLVDMRELRKLLITRKVATSSRCELDNAQLTQQSQQDGDDSQYHNTSTQQIQGQRVLRELVLIYAQDKLVKKFKNTSLKTSDCIHGGITDTNIVVLTVLTDHRDEYTNDMPHKIRVQCLNGKKFLQAGELVATAAKVCNH